MSTYDDDPTARIADHQVEVAATPEEVWQAIATGPGISAWFVPSEVEEHVGGRITTDHGPYGRSVGRVTTWDPPHRFGYVEEGWNPEAPDAPPWATEVLVEARDGRTCTVRLVSGFFSGGEGWEEHLEGTDEGWRSALQILRQHLAHFPGQATTQLMCFGTVAAGREEALTALRQALGVQGLAVGDLAAPQPDVPDLTGVVADLGPDGLLLRIEQPCPGLLELGAFSAVPGADGATTVAVRGYLHGDSAPAVADREQPRWTAWLAERFEGFEPVT